MTTLIVRDDRFLAHDAGAGHPENAARLAHVLASLDEIPVARTTTVAPTAAERGWLEAVHTASHVDRIEASARRAHLQLDPDTATCPASWEAARLGSGGLVQATQAVVSGSHSGAFVLARPPGHHAEAEAAMGFCLFNHVAVAAEHAVRELGCRRVLVLDPDVHHGNGTQRAFWSRRDVMYVSSHRFPFYPGTGAPEEIGAGVGAGHTINLPLEPGMGDADLLHVWDHVVTPAVTRWEPDLILVSAGFDTWYRDPLGGLAVTADGFRAWFALVRSWAEACCPGRVAAVLEGGYDPAGVTAGVRAGVEVLASVDPPGHAVEGEPSDKARAVAGAARERLRGFWPDVA